MSLEKELLKRAESKCELCGSENDLKAFDVSRKGGNADGAILACGTCHEQLSDDSKIGLKKLAAFFSLPNAQSTQI